MAVNWQERAMLAENELRMQDRRYSEAVNELRKHISELRKRLSGSLVIKTADGAVITPGMKVYRKVNRQSVITKDLLACVISTEVARIIIDRNGTWVEDSQSIDLWPTDECYLNSEAAEVRKDGVK